MLYLVDTDVLLRAVDRKSPEHASIGQAFRVLRVRADKICVSAQNIREFWSVSTRPESARGGYGRSVEWTERWVRTFDRVFRILPETPATFTRWHALVTQHRVMGVQVHDANLVAVAETYGIETLLTLNPSDFKRFTSLTVITPAELATVLE